MFSTLFWGGVEFFTLFLNLPLAECGGSLDGQQMQMEGGDRESWEFLRETGEITNAVVWLK